jgi:peroxiredoxin Q/BCP
MAQLAVGDRAPAFTRTDHDGHEVSSESLRGTRTVLYFFPKADTSG